jgi:hypothetical protein
MAAVPRIALDPENAALAVKISDDVPASAPRALMAADWPKTRAADPASAPLAMSDADWLKTIDALPAMLLDLVADAENMMDELPTIFPKPLTAATCENARAADACRDVRPAIVAD